MVLHGGRNNEDVNDMKHVNSTFAAGLAACLLAVLSSSGVYAQQPIAQGAEILRIKSVTDLGREYQQRAIGLGAKSPKSKTWGVFDVVFDTAPLWIDELTVTYSVMLSNDKVQQGEKPMSLMKLTVEYADIAQGRDHRAGVVVPAVALERYGKPIGFAVQIFVGGNPVAEAGVVDGFLKDPKVRERWWANSAVTDSPAVQKRDGYLVERSKSVFSLVDIDSYEAGR